MGPCFRRDNKLLRALRLPRNRVGCGSRIYGLRPLLYATLRVNKVKIQPSPKHIQKTPREAGLVVWLRE